MVELWYSIVAFALAAYVVLDGFDLGAGTLHLYVARNDDERRAVISAIGPYWDGNEVWLLTIAGALFVGFPSVLAAAFSGMYLAMFLALWGLVFRGISIELRGQSKNELWRALWDFMFTVASGALPLLFGVVLGNLLRGFPLDASGMVVLPLFADFTPSPPTGLLDWYTLTVGVFAFVALALHGALFLAWKTDGDVRARCLATAARLWPLALALWIACFAASASVARLTLRPLAIAWVAVAAGAFVAMILMLRRGRRKLAFVSSSAFLASVIAGIASATFPTVLRSVDDRASLDAYGSSSSSYAMHAGAVWFLFGLAAVGAWFSRLFREAER